jgi:hypothetical protein
MTKRTRITFNQVNNVFPEVERWASVAGYKLVPEPVESGRMYQKGTGLMVAPMMLSVRQASGSVEMEAWVRCNLFMRIMSAFMLPAEMGIESGGFRGVLPRQIARNAVNGLLKLLGQPEIR